jgi:hypothetical protein
MDKCPMEAYPAYFKAKATVCRAWLELMDVRKIVESHGWDMEEFIRREEMPVFLGELGSRREDMGKPVTAAVLTAASEGAGDAAAMREPVEAITIKKLDETHYVVEHTQLSGGKREAGYFESSIGGVCGIVRSLLMGITPIFTSVRREPHSPAANNEGGRTMEKRRETAIPYSGDSDVALAIRSERIYQEAKWGGHGHNVGEWLLIMEKCLNDAKRAWSAAHGGAKVLSEVRQVAATAIACLEQHGAPVRELNPAMTDDNDGDDPERIE